MLSDQTPVPKAPRLSEDTEEEKNSHRSRVDSVHGGIVVEEIETPQPMNNPDCEHEFELDSTETDFIAYRCKKPSCGIVMLYDK